MKVTSATVRLCRASRSGEFPIYLVVCYHGRVEKSTGISCAIQYWDEGRERNEELAGIDDDCAI